MFKKIASGCQGIIYVVGFVIDKKRSIFTADVVYSQRRNCKQIRNLSVIMTLTTKYYAACIYCK